MKHSQVKHYLDELQQALIAASLWDSTPPSPEALASTEPFSIDHLDIHQWLQWIFIPRMQAIIDANAELPLNFAITPYLDEALKEHPHLMAINTPLLKLEALLKDE